jgi:hypothetical protein
VKVALSQRRFGVEIECGHPDGPSGVLNELTKNKLKPLSVGADGSGVEVRSPVLKGVPGLKKLEEIYQCLREYGCYVTNSDGAHVHHEALDFRETVEEKIVLEEAVKKSYRAMGYTAREINRLFPPGRTRTVIKPLFKPSLVLIKSFNNNEKILDTFVAKRRRGPAARHCSKVWKSDTIKQYEKDQKYPGVPRGALNLNSVLRSSKGTIEIRMHEGTLDFEEIEAWIRLGQALIEYAVKNEEPLEKCKNGRDLLEKLGIDEDYTERLVAKAKRSGAPAENSRWHPSRDQGILSARAVLRDRVAQAA